MMTEAGTTPSGDGLAIDQSKQYKANAGSCGQCGHFKTWDFKILNPKTGKQMPGHITKEGFKIGDGNCPYWEAISKMNAKKPERKAQPQSPGTWIKEITGTQVPAPGVMQNVIAAPQGTAPGTMQNVIAAPQVTTTMPPVATPVHLPGPLIQGDIVLAVGIMKVIVSKKEAIAIIRDLSEQLVARE